MPTELAHAAVTAGGAARFDLLGAFLLGYVAILATPGPNLIAVGSIAALRGLRGALPLCLGIAAGAGALGATLLLAAGTVADAIPGGQTAGRIGAALLLLMASVLVARMAPPGQVASAAASPGRLEAATGGAAAFFGAGFCTAAANPLTGAFFAAQFLGPLGTAQGGATTALLALPGIVTTALAVMLGVAALLARPAIRRAALTWHRPVRATASIALLATGAATLWPVLWP